MIRSPNERTDGGSERGASEMVGVILLFGLVIAGAAVVLLIGTTAKKEVTQTKQIQKAEMSMQDLDGRLGSLANDNSNPIRTFDLTSKAGAVSLQTSDSMRITLHDGTSWNSKCQATISLDEVEYTLDDGRKVTYQAGGVFKTTGSGTEMVSAPDIEFNNWSLDVTVVNLMGDLSDEFQAKKNITKSNERTQQKMKQLFGHEGCRRPNKMRFTVTITDDYRVWKDYLTSSMPSGVKVVPKPGANQITVVVPSKFMPDRVDDQKNSVVDFTSSGMGELKVKDDKLHMIVDKKDDDNVYTASGTMLGSSVGYNETETHKVPVYGKRKVPVYGNKSVPIYNNTSKKVYRTVLIPVKNGSKSGKPLDVTFVMDESGSMRGDKMKNAKAAVRHFISVLPNGQGHRAGLVGYSTRYGSGDIFDESDGYAKIHEKLTTDQGQVKAGVKSLKADGRTPIGNGLNKALDHFNSSAKKDHEQIMILLTDGLQNTGQEPYGGWWGEGPMPKIIDRNITVHTIAVGSGADKSLMKKIAGDTDGEYHFVTDSDDLDDVFDDIVKNETYRKKKVFDHWENTSKIVGYKNKSGVVGYKNETYVKGYKTVVDSRKIVHIPTTVSFNTPSLSSPQSLVEGSSPVERAVNYHSVSADGVQVKDGEPLAIRSRFHSCASGSLKTTGETSTAPSNSSNVFEHYRCTATTGAWKDPDEITTFVKGDELPTVSGEQKPAWWQTRFKQMVEEYTKQMDADAPDEFTLESNQVVVVYHYDDDGDGTNERNNVVMLYEIGNSKSDMVADWLINLRISMIDANWGK